MHRVTNMDKINPHTQHIPLVRTQKNQGFETWLQDKRVFITSKLRFKQTCSVQRTCISLYSLSFTRNNLDAMDAEVSINTATCKKRQQSTAEYITHHTSKRIVIKTHGKLALTWSSIIVPNNSLLPCCNHSILKSKVNRILIKKV